MRPAVIFGFTQSSLLTREAQVFAFARGRFGAGKFGETLGVREN